MAGTPIVADNDCWTMAEICIKMAWITKAKNSFDIEAEAEVPDARAGAEATVGENIVVEVKHDEDTTSNELSKLFLVWWGSMANDEVSWPNRLKKVRQKGANTLWSNNLVNWSQIDEQKGKKQQGNSKH